MVQTIPDNKSNLQITNYKIFNLSEAHTRRSSTKLKTYCLPELHLPRLRFKSLHCPPSHESKQFLASQEKVQLPPRQSILHVSIPRGQIMLQEPPSQICSQVLTSLLHFIEQLWPEHVCLHFPLIFSQNKLPL